jgi:Zn-dependent hydrolases, including glyoxylases
MNRASASPYEVIALRYATREGRRPSHFIGGDPHDAPMPMAYYVWVIRNAERTILVDTGFHEDMAVKRNRQLLIDPPDALRRIDIDPASIQDVILTHLHNDHVGGFADYPSARFHLQDAEMAFATGRHMCCEIFRKPFEPDHVAGLIRLVYGDRVVFHDGDADIAPGVSVHRVGGHTAGLQIVRVWTTRGWLVLASDASHFYEHFQAGRCFPLVFSVGDVLHGYALLRRLAASEAHIIPGHDPLVMQRYPPYQGHSGLAVALHEPESTGLAANTAGHT